MHRGLSPRVQRDCIGCHPAHNARIVSAANQCAVCHVAGRRPVADGMATRAVAGRVSASLSFRHDTHRQVTCTACHETQQEHSTPPAMALATCRSCHHTERAGRSCLSCHERTDVAAVRTQVTRALDITVGKLARPERVLPFDHALHLTQDCQACHAGNGLARSAAAVNCAGCHTDHSRPDANCSACHRQPPAGAHTRAAHLGCGGAGCHQQAAGTMLELPRTRSLCLACHRDRTEHEPGSVCVSCHALPQPRGNAR
jgi:hypothetical protein